jgi:hypothetical protein
MGIITHSEICTFLNGHLLEAPREYVLHGLDSLMNWSSCGLAYIRSSLFALTHSFRTWPSHSSWTVSHQYTSKQHARTTSYVHNMHIHSTFILLSTLFFTLRLLSWASRLAQTLPIWHTYHPMIHLSWKFVLICPVANAITDIYRSMPITSWTFCPHNICPAITKHTSQQEDCPFTYLSRLAYFWS